MKSIGVVVFLLVSVGIFAACSSAEAGAIPATEFTVTATDIAYDMHRLEVTAGQSVRVTLRNDGVLEHDFSIIEIPHTGKVFAEEAEGGMASHDMGNMSMDPEIHVASPVGDSLSVEFTPTTPGEYEFFCTVAGHKEAGMVGTLVVTAP